MKIENLSKTTLYIYLYLLVGCNEYAMHFCGTTSNTGESTWTQTGDNMFKLIIIPYV